MHPILQSFLYRQHFHYFLFSLFLSLFSSMFLNVQIKRGLMIEYVSRYIFVANKYINIQ